MSDFPGSTVPTPLLVHSWCTNTAASSMPSLVTLGPTAQTWVANLAIYIPVLLPWPYLVQSVFWSNGSTITTSNGDFGIYTADGRKIYSTGSTALSGTSVPQYVNPTAFTLSAGSYYFAFACDNTTNRVSGLAPAAGRLRLAGVLQQASAFPLPATMTGASVSNALYPLIGIGRTTTAF